MSDSQPNQRPAPILVGVFPDEANLRRAADELAARGIGRDFVGALIQDGESFASLKDKHGRYLLSVRVPRRRQDEVVALLQRHGAVAVGEPDEIEARYGPTPHPGAWEERDLKLPGGREYPDTEWPPALSWYRVRMRTLDTRERLRHFGEVELGYTLAEAWEEASRCLLCPQPRCVQGCPAHNDIPGFVRALLDGDFARGVSALRRTSNFPGICGRVCNKAEQCEGACILNEEGGEPVAIGALERFLADWELKESRRLQQAEGKQPPTGKRVAIVGSGPSGLAAAGDLAMAGHPATLFEALPVMGGALAWGIPTFRLPQEVVQAEIDYLTALCVEFQLGVKVGKDVALDDLMAQGYAAIFIGAGADVSVAPGLPGQDLEGIYTATEFLSHAKLSRVAQLSTYKPPRVGKRLAVIGAGNTAMDVAQTALRLGWEPMGDGQTTADVVETALRLGVEEVTVVYRRSEAEMPARPEEVQSAREEGVHFKFLTAPVRFIGDARGRVAAMEGIEMALGQPDASGRRRPVPKPGTEFQMAVDTVVLAIGYQPDPTVVRSTSGLNTNPDGLLVVDRATGRTRRPGVWAGGDIVLGPDTVVRAMVAGKVAARDIDSWLRSGS